MKYLDWLKTNPEKGYYWVRPYDCYEERIDEFTDWYDNAGNVETKFTEQPDEVISDRLTYIDYLEMIGHCGAYKTANEVLKDKNKNLKELLKECRPYIALYTENNKHIGFTPETANLLQRIKEVLK